jgi:FKBP-type peptidyl-prolyl cis-trans isomerase
MSRVGAASTTLARKVIDPKLSNDVEVCGVVVSVITLQAGDATNFPKSGQTVRIHYNAFLADGTQFDSSRAREQPITFKLDAGTV